MLNGIKNILEDNLHTLFLNDVEEGGELEFLHQSIRIKPRKGDFVIFLAFFTHLHRGNPPLSDENGLLLDGMNN